VFINMQIVCLSSGWVEAVGGKDMVVKSSGVGGMITTQEKITIPANGPLITKGATRVSYQNDDEKLSCKMIGHFVD
jgi:hypothetical protein